MNSVLFVVAWTSVCFAAGTGRIDLFDKSNNRLMFVTFTTDAAGSRTGDSVFMADSMFVRATTVQSGAKEISLSFNGDTTGKTVIATSGATTSFSVFDQFGLDQLGGPVSYSGDGATFDLSQRGTVVNKMRYSTVAGGDLRIDVLDNSGNLLYYAATNVTDAGAQGRLLGAAVEKTSVRFVSQDRYRLTVRLEHAARVRAELFLPSGRLAAVVADKRMDAGTHAFFARAPSRCATGIYIMRLSIDGKRIADGAISSIDLAQTAASPAQAIPPSLIFELLALNGDLETAQRPKYRSPTALVASPDKKKLYVAEQTAKCIAVVDVEAGAVTSEYLLPNEPTGIAISRDGATLFVTCSSERWPAGLVCVLNSATGVISRQVSVGHSARAPVVSPDGATLYVCNWFDNTVSVVDIAAGRESGRIPVTREPYAAAITPDGKTLVVTNSLPDQKATDTTAISCKIALINTATRTVEASIPLPVGSHSLFGVSISPDGKYAFATHLIGRMTIPATTLSQGWVHSNNLAVVDIVNKRLLNDIELDDANMGVANPWGLACTNDGKFICILHAGSNQMTTVDLPQLIAKASGSANLSHDFNAIAPFKKVISVAGKGPRSIAVIDSTAYIASYFSDALDVAGIRISGFSPPSTIRLGVDKAMTVERKGEFLWTDASICFQKWQSCFSCHPFTRPDALNWVLSQSAFNAPKNVKSMLYSFQTAPTNWAGRRPDAFQSVEYGIRLELQIEPSPDMTLPLDTFLMRLKPVPSPFLQKGRLSASGKAGQALYAGSKVDCKYCHPAPLFTDNKFWNSGVPDQFDPTTAWNTPSINEAWRTAPYDHIGSTTSMADMLRLPGHSTNVARLTAQEFTDLLTYVNSL